MTHCCDLGIIIFANRLAPSRDIAHGFNVIGHLRALCAGGVLENGSDRRYMYTKMNNLFFLLLIYETV